MPASHTPRLARSAALLYSARLLTGVDCCCCGCSWLLRSAVCGLRSGELANWLLLADWQLQLRSLLWVVAFAVADWLLRTRMDSEHKQEGEEEEKEEEE